MLLAVGLVVLAVFCMVAWQVEDWGRDLTTNRAATSLDANDTTLRSLELSATLEEVCEAIEQFVERSENWKTQVGEKVSEGDDGQVVLLSRTSQLFRFVDDVHVYLQVTAGGIRVDVASRSRLGKGDLGQNPRNIRTLLRALQGSQ